MQIFFFDKLRIVIFVRHVCQRVTILYFLIYDQKIRIKKEQQNEKRFTALEIINYKAINYKTYYRTIYLILLWF